MASRRRLRSSWDPTLPIFLQNLVFSCAHTHSVWVVHKHVFIRFCLRLLHRLVQAARQWHKKYLSAGDSAKRATDLKDRECHKMHTLKNNNKRIPPPPMASITWNHVRAASRYPLQWVVDGSSGYPETCYSSLRVFFGIARKLILPGALPAKEKLSPRKPPFW